MCRVDEEPLGIMISISRGAGTCVGTVAAAGKKITGFVVGGVTAAGRFLTRPVEIPELIADEQAESTPGGFGIVVKDRQETEPKQSAKFPRGAQDSDLATVKDQSKRLQSKAEELQTENQVVKPQPSHFFGPVQTEHSLPTPLEEVVVVSAEEHSGTSWETAMTRVGEEKVIERDKEQLHRVVSVNRAPTLSAVSENEVRKAIFENTTERTIFRMALSDIGNQDTAVRADAVKRIAGIGHELSVRVLVNQMPGEPSAQVRQECVKALATLQTTEGLRAVEQALGDRSALVRLAAVWGLYRSAGAQSGPALVRMFSDKDAEIRRRAVTCIGWLGRERFAADLLPLLDDRSVSVRLAAVEAMGALNCRQGVSALIEHLNDPEKAVTKAVITSLKTITGKKMSGPFPRDSRSLQRLIERWRQWWKEEQGG